MKYQYEFLLFSLCVHLSEFKPPILADLIICQKVACSAREKLNIFQNHLAAYHVTGGDFLPRSLTSKCFMGSTLWLLTPASKWMPKLKAAMILNAIAVFLPEIRLNRCGEDSCTELNLETVLLLTDGILNREPECVLQI